MWYTYKDDTLLLTVHVQPGAKITEINNIYSAALKIRLKAPPVDGKANDALKKYLALLFEVPKQQVQIRHGQHSKRKIIAIIKSHIDPNILIKT